MNTKVLPWPMERAIEMQRAMFGPFSPWYWLLPRRHEEEAQGVMEYLLGVSLNDVGSASRAWTQLEVEQFAKLCLDKNRLHLDEDFARETIFRGRIVHGALVKGLISAAIGNTWHGCLLVEEQFRYRKPVYPNQKVEAIAKVTELLLPKPDQPRALLECVASVGDKVVVVGHTLIQLPPK